MTWWRTTELQHFVQHMYMESQSVACSGHAPLSVCSQSAQTYVVSVWGNGRWLCCIDHYRVLVGKYKWYTVLFLLILSGIKAVTCDGCYISRLTSGWVCHLYIIWRICLYVMVLRGRLRGCASCAGAAVIQAVLPVAGNSKMSCLKHLFKDWYAIYYKIKPCVSLHRYKCPMNVLFTIRP